jgi:hypothetical protein
LPGFVVAGLACAGDKMVRQGDKQILIW